MLFGDKKIYNGGGDARLSHVIHFVGKCILFSYYIIAATVTLVRLINSGFMHFMEVSAYSIKHVLRFTEHYKHHFDNLFLDEMHLIY